MIYSGCWIPLRSFKFPLHYCNPSCRDRLNTGSLSVRYRRNKVAHPDVKLYLFSKMTSGHHLPTCMQMSFVWPISSMIYRMSRLQFLGGIVGGEDIGGFIDSEQ